VAAIPSNERHGLRAAFEVGADRLSTAGGRLADLFGLAAVVGDEGVGQSDAAADGQYVVTDTVNPEVGDRVLAAIAIGATARNSPARAQAMA
jgi:hypothetical protein